MGWRDSTPQTCPRFLLGELVVVLVGDALVVASGVPLDKLFGGCVCTSAWREAPSVCTLTPNSFFLPAAVLSDYESAEDSEVRGVSVLVFCRAAASCVVLAQNPVCVLRSLPLTLSAAISVVSRYQLVCSCAEVWSEPRCSVVIAAAEENSLSLSTGIYLVCNPQEKPRALLIPWIWTLGAGFAVAEKAVEGSVGCSLSFN